MLSEAKNLYLRVEDPSPGTLWVQDDKTEFFTRNWYQTA